MPIFEDLTRKKFGMLSVIKMDKRDNQNRYRWLCKCDCGEQTIVRGHQLKNGNTKSCGCLKYKPCSQTTKNKISEALSKKIKFKCDYCGIQTSSSKSTYDKKKRHFCSMKCYSDFRKELLSFNEQNSYKGIRKLGDTKQVYHANYCKAHPNNIAHLKARRYAREKGAKGKHSLEEWEKLKIQFNYKCAICGEEKPLTKDHIKPLSKGGSDYIYNIQPLCRNCNSKKNNKF